MDAVFPFFSRPLRRSAATVLALSALLAASVAQAQAFDFESLTKLARERADKPFVAASDKLPADLAQLNYDQVRDIRYKPERALWRAEKLPFEAMFFHLGLYQTQPVRIHEVTPTGTRDIPYSRADFDYGKNTVQPQAWGDLGFAGFRLHNHLNAPEYKDELAVFQGASYFRALGAGQQYGLSARGLAIDTVGGSGEEFPRFTDFWLAKPDAQGKQVAVFALLDSPRATGAYRFDITPGPQTLTTVRARVFVRGNAAKPIGTLGVAPLTSMFFFGENQPRKQDFRPEVHDSDGLMVATGEGEWLWRPLQNPGSTLVTSFTTTNPKGFGLMQRDRQWASYEDVEARYERRPSAWVRPLHDWGPGRVELVQNNTPDETHDNIVAYWVPAKLPAPGTPLEFSYELGWQGDEQQRPPGSWVTQSRRGMGFSKQSAQELRQQVQYVVDFTGPALAALPADAAVKAVVTADANGKVLENAAYRNPATGQWRMTVRVQRQQADRPIELRAFLQHDNNAVSETWTHIILPE
ncbi:periplasmic glucans biosynthesis protein [Acidovorax sp. CF316]|uniref:glucan biosynthesis protein G n=1 Tax=Acidovorax sp. CF316 TaxID=1144317 RepID=UPI00026BBF13|nr:glucan biosynthesis protein G [Acidovorax sp. CF316]EJE53254.1 periplasmic glucans biosynthesis protein [Acidovorax sp. CF316]